MLLFGAVNMSQRYITDRFLPDKQLIWLMKACASIRVKIDSLPEELKMLLLREKNRLENGTVSIEKEE